MATAQVAHVAARAAAHPNFPDINDDTHFVILSCPEDPDIYADRLTHWIGSPEYYIGDSPVEHLIAFWEPDLDDKMTAFAVFNPPSKLFQNLPLFPKEVN